MWIMKFDGCGKLVFFKFSLFHKLSIFEKNYFLLQYGVFIFFKKLFYLPKRHPRLDFVLFCVLADKGALAKALASKEQIFLVADGGDDDGGNAEAERAKGIGEELIAQGGGFLDLDTQGIDSAKKRTARGLFAVCKGGKTKCFVKSFDARRMIVGNERGTNSVFLEGIEPRANVVVGIGLLLGGERVVDVDEQGANADLL